MKKALAITLILTSLIGGSAYAETSKWKEWNEFASWYNTRIEEITQSDLSVQTKKELVSVAYSKFEETQIRLNITDRELGVEP